MALSTLFDGSDYRGIQQDFFGIGQASSSQQSFRTQVPQNSTLQEAARFFADEQSRTIPSPYHQSFNSFDLHSLRINLPEVKSPVNAFTPQSNSAGNSSWSSDFLNLNQMILRSPEINSITEPSQGQLPDTHFQHRSGLPLALGLFRISQNIISADQIIVSRPFHMGSTPQRDSLEAQANRESFWEHFFPSEELVTFNQINPPADIIHEQPTDADELSKTAALLIDAVKEELNPKFKNSSFLSLMRQLRDKEMTIQGSEMVQSNPSNTVDGKGKGRSKPENGFADAFVQNTTQVQDFHLDRNDPLTAGPSTRPAPPVMDSITQMRNEVETDDDRYWKEENAAYQQYWSHTSMQDGFQRYPEWDRLQEDWEKFEATSTGIKMVSSYPFQANNPYLQTDFVLGNHSSHTLGEQRAESLLELEAAVQKDPRDPTRWYQLGVKQQENEREQSAILALRRATQLNPSFLDAWLALAVSYTNEGDKSGAYSAIRSWLDNNSSYNHEAIPTLDGQENGELMQRLMSLIRQTSDGAIDADLQTALGIVLNTSEDFERAQDCFRTALSVRPNDWLLYNRVGATLANSGQAKSAIWYYYQALALNPSYIRARRQRNDNPQDSISQYDEAARHVLDALVLQETDTSSSDTRGITSSALWECLRTTCMQLQRMDLVTFCDAHDLKESSAATKGTFLSSFVPSFRASSAMLSFLFAMNSLTSETSASSKGIKETRLSALRPVGEFFDYNRISRPADLNQATSRISYNTRYFSGNYGLVIATLAVYALLTTPLLLIALVLLTGGFIVINKWGMLVLLFGRNSY
ncbi:hypothetical protein Clacol_000507 [Clathrus columnatus]|uniref:TPR-like protein n=1 Tax=Clathrus columnatus TaxID=1419009 RepID=A0AAV4ZWM4_9AGAM|nr:hypothetical protein Clacol_000507 [Clathrus columnatus]